MPAFNLPPFDTATLSRGVPKICQNGSPKCVFRGAESDCIRLSKTRRFWEPRLRDSNLFAARFLTKCVRPTNGSALVDETIPVASLWQRTPTELAGRDFQVSANQAPSSAATTIGFLSRNRYKRVQVGSESFGRVPLWPKPYPIDQRTKRIGQTQSCPPIAMSLCLARPTRTGSLRVGARRR